MPEGTINDTVRMLTPMVDLRSVCIAVCSLLLLAACSSASEPIAETPEVVLPAGDAVIPRDVPTLTVGETQAIVFGSEFVEVGSGPVVSFSEMESFDQWSEVLVPESDSYDAVLSTAVLPSHVDVWLMSDLDETGEPGPPVLIGACNVFASGAASCQDGQTGDPSSLQVAVISDGIDPVRITIEPPPDLEWAVAMVQGNWFGASKSPGSIPRAMDAWFFMVGDCDEFC